MSGEEAETALEARYLSEGRRSVVLSAKRLAEYAKKKNIPFERRDLEEMRYRFKFSAFSAPFRKPNHYMSSSIQKYGVVQLDLAEFHPKHRRSNRGCAAFLVGKESLSGQLAIHPVKDKTTASWEKGVVAMAEAKFNAVRVLVTDRDSAVKSDAFRKSVKKRFGISWTWLKARNKCFKSERFVIVFFD
jgi:hypothetical protein